ncbi:Proline--tRNA ligase [Nosema granulosis]|uniref:proline--tRNA ligase n=1 Tax=Nosema granulosis TaxID=83296 RepID=A0A9P6GZ20_9MICR|nr:Proline--tRNA ligase [Nosema granulosis]
MEKQKFGINAKKEENFSEWYQQVIVKGELLDYYDIKGCYIMRPSGQFIWKVIKEWFDKEISKLGVQECYFPMLIPKKALEKEKTHIDDFSPEVAWITQCGGETLQEPVAIRPTSETIMYPSFSKWIQSHRDLPLKLNQWCSVLRWELRGTMPFIRGKEFLWQEGHTAHLNREDADKEVMDILELYYRVFKDLLAVPVIKGMKSENERFAGADYTTSLEAFIPDSGRGVQAATSHSLGTNFSKIFDIKIFNEKADDKKTVDKKISELKVLDGGKMNTSYVQTEEDSNHTFVFQNSWGITTRSIGIAVMIHSDNKGLVLPPKVANIQIVIVPCGISAKTSPEDRKMVMDTCESINKVLVDNNIRSHFDTRDNVSAGYKFNHWEIRGIPLRLEIGPRDIKNNEVCVYIRFSGEKKTLKIHKIASESKYLINCVHEEMYSKAKKRLQEGIKHVETFEEFLKELDNKKIIMAPWCQNNECEENIKKNSTKHDENNKVISTGAKSLCIPFEAEIIEKQQKCVCCGEKAVKKTLFGRSY